MICSKCSAEMPEISVYCPACGYPVNEASDPLRANDGTDKLLAAFAYVAVVPAIAFLFVPAIRIRSFVRFHAWQALMFVAASCVLAMMAVLIFRDLTRYLPSSLDRSLPEVAFLFPFGRKWVRHYWKGNF